MVAIVEGEDLVIVDIEERLLSFLGYTPLDRPRTVYDLMPRSVTSHHRRWVKQAIQENCLPARLKHPLQNIQIRHRRGFFVQMDILIDWIKETDRPCFQLVFLSNSSYAVRDVTEVHVGRSVEHEQAIVMLLDIMEFTKACSQISASQVSYPGQISQSTPQSRRIFSQVLDWMRDVRAAIETALQEHGLRLIETRGDNYLAVTTQQDGPEPAVRAVSFAAAAAAAVDCLSTRIRVGLACGPVVIAPLQCMGCREVLCVFGDVVNVAGRLEQARAHPRVCRVPRAPPGSDVQPEGSQGMALPRHPSCTARAGRWPPGSDVQPVDRPWRRMYSPAHGQHP